VYAALDYGDTATADALCDALEARFGTASTRTRATRAATALGKGEHAAARRLLDDALEEHPGEARLRRMRVACAKAAGDDAGAIAAMTAYLEDFGADEEAWLELGRLYAERCAYERALFCYEEVLCAKPFDANAHRRIGEVLLAMDGEENVRLATHHFSAAIDFTNGKDMRALYAVVMCVKKLRVMAAARGETFRDTSALELADAAAERLLQRYASENESLLAIVRPLLKEATEI
jgi:tetratricopeptide (TPR) repeat protein